jgi:hypothetical protein
MHSSILLTVTLRRNGYTYLSRAYIYLVTYICPTKFKLCPTKIKSDRTNVLSSQIFICSPGFMYKNNTYFIVFYPRVNEILVL